MTNDDLPKIPPLEEVLRGLDEKYPPEKDNFNEESHPVAVRRPSHLRPIETFEYPPVAVHSPITPSPIIVNCMIKEKHNHERDGRIQILQNSIICPHIRSRKDPNKPHYCSIITTDTAFSLIYEDCPFYKEHILRK